ncbi:MAG: CPBP family intramembrane glutamic endopeptidase [Gammaproteobacteria bacterium]|jgi:membrane protease YdiL (CAAX protease family)
MPALLFFLLYLGVALVLSALLFYPVFQAVDALWNVRPDRLFYRLVMIIAALGFWPFVKLLTMNNRDALGYSLKRGGYLMTAVKGLGIGVLIMSVHAVLLVLLGARVPEPGNVLLSELAITLLTGLFSGILVAVIEESFFRGALQHGMRRHSNVLSTFIGVNLFYAAVHFTRPPLTPEAVIIDGFSGWQMLAGMLHQYGDFTDFMDSFITLFVAGLLLSLIRDRTGNIVLCIGIHAGWVLSIKMARELTNAASDTPAALLIGSYDNITGWAATAVLGLVTIGYWRYRHHK